MEKGTSIVGEYSGGLRQGQNRRGGSPTAGLVQQQAGFPSGTLEIRAVLQRSERWGHADFAACGCLVGVP